MNEDPGSARAEMEAAFLDAGLVAPPVPDALGDALRAERRWSWGTEDMPFSLYNLEANLEFASRREVLAVGHAGHGMNSYAITYLLGFGPLFVGAQIPWGGAYQDAEEAAADVVKRFGQIARLVKLAEETRRSESRLLVVHRGLKGTASLGWALDGQALGEDWISEHRVEEDEFDLAMRMFS